MPDLFLEKFGAQSAFDSIVQPPSSSFKLRRKTNRLRRFSEAIGAA
jgi:hypothetical protein